MEDGGGGGRFRDVFEFGFVGAAVAFAAAAVFWKEERRDAKSLMVINSCVVHEWFELICL